MKTTKYLSLAALALMGTLASCQSDDELTIARPDNAVGINVSVGSLQATRSNPAATDPDEAKNFNQGDQVCVSTDGQDPVLFQCQNADQQTWAEAEAGKFLLWTQSEMTFKAYYPATEGTSMTSFTLPADQSTEANIALADYMTRQQTFNNENGNNINLELERKTARVIVNIAGFTNQYDNDEKTVSNVSINSLYSGIANGNGGGDITAVNPYQQGNGGLNTTYTALVVPGDGDSGADFITLTDGESNTLKVKGIPELREGYSYTFNLTVGKNTIQVQSVTVTDWATGTTLTGGQAQEQGSAAYTQLSAATAEDIGKVVCAAGHLHDAMTAVPTGCTAVGILGKVTETGHGLILALQDATSQVWNTINGWTSETNYAGTTLKLLPDDAARGTYLPSYTSLGETAVSNWAVAQKSDYSAIFINLGSTTGNSDFKIYDANVNAYITTGVGGTAMSGYYWSATVDNSNNAHRIYNGSWDIWWRSESENVRPVLGFGGQAQEQGGAAAAEGHALSASAVGEIVGSNGLAYAAADKDNLPSGVTAVAKICYVSGSNGLALALTDEEGTKDWSTAKTVCAAHTPAITGGTWKLASVDEWNNMISAAGSHTALRDGFSSVGGTNMSDYYYWSSTEFNSDIARDYDFDLGEWSADGKGNDDCVRACLAF